MAYWWLSWPVRNNTAIASVRDDPQAAVSQTLNDLPKAKGTSMNLVNINLNVPTDPVAAVEALKPPASQTST